MAFEFHHLDKWEYANLDLVEEAQEKGKKALVLIAGASSSGKSFAASALRQMLSKNGHRALVLSLDQYNFGLSGIIPNKVNQNLFQGSLRNLPEISRRIKKIIYGVPFEKKYAPEVLEKISPAVAPLLSPSDLPKFLEGLAQEWAKLNFDEPSVYNLPEAAKDLKVLLSDGKVLEKRYSKVVSERVPTHHYLDGSKYDVLILEGIYALDPSMLKALDGLFPICNFVDGNPKSLFLRRVLRDKRLTSADNVFTIRLYFRYIIPSYLEQILPCRGAADVILNNNMTFGEMREGELYVTKEEVFTSDVGRVSAFLFKAKVLDWSYLRDTFFTVPMESERDIENNILRMREVSKDGGKTYVPSSLVHKGALKVRRDDKKIRPINLLLGEGEFSRVWPTASECIQDFQRAGFVVGNVQRKQKIHLLYQGQALTVRIVEGKGAYVEFSSPLHPAVVSKVKDYFRNGN